MPAYSTDTYPYPEAMWDEAAEHLTTRRGWSTVLLVCPDPAGAVADAEAALASRGLAVNACVVADVFSDAHLMRLSALTHIDPRWDDVEHHLLNHAVVALVAIDYETVVADEVIEEARAAMAERGLAVAVGYASDPASRMGLLRVERA